MHWRSVIRLFGVLLLLYSLSFLPSVIVSWLYADGQARVFGWSLLLTAAAGTMLWLAHPRAGVHLSMRDGFFVVTLFWVVLGGIGALPFMLGLQLSFVDALFESVSGFTTTGATVLVGLDRLPPSILYHRQQIQWLGGMGVIVLAVAILPLIGGGGNQLYRAETSGVAKHEKLTPRIAETARALWTIYTGLTLTCALAFWLAGMSAFDAISHAFTTVSTGGFSTHDASIGYFNSPLIESIAIFFMLAGGINFAVHFTAWHRQQAAVYLRDPEVRIYGLIFLVFTLFIALGLITTHTYDSRLQALRHAAFQVASILTSTGFGTANFADWPLHLPLVLVVLGFVGGCVGSTAGGMKVLRVMLIAKQGLRELFVLAHPQAMAVVKLGKRPIDAQTLSSVWGFAALYLLTTLILTIAMMALGLDLESAFGAVAATINLTGPGLGAVATSFAGLGPEVKWLAIFAMLVGRLEVFTLLILFLPAYWRH